MMLTRRDARSIMPAMHRRKLNVALLGFSLSLMLAAGCTSDDRDSGTGAPTTIGDTLTDDDGDAGDGFDDDDAGPRLDAMIGDGDGDGDGGGDDGNPSGDPCGDAAKAKSNQGCEFWAVDLPNVWEGSSGSPAPADMQFAVVVANTADAPAQVEIYRGHEGGQLVDSNTVPVDGTMEFRLPALNIDPRADTNDGEAYLIRSDLPITAYQFNPLDNTTQVFSNDASLLLPSHVLANDYAAVTGDGLSLSTNSGVDNSGAFVSVVGTEDGTVVELFPTRPTYAGGGARTINLDRGQVYTMISNDTASGTAGQGNLSGTRVAADKPVAVFSGNVAAIEPFPAPPTGGCCADHIEHQMPPLVAWGQAYVAAPVPAPNLVTTSGSDETAYRITGGYDDTTLEYTPSAPPGAPTTIGAYQTATFRTNLAFTVKSTDPDKTFALTQFVQSADVVRSGIPVEPTGHPGDPAMIVLSAAAQFQDDYVFLVPMGYQYNYVTVYRPAGASVSLDGMNVTVANWRPIGAMNGVSWEFAHFPVQPGQHRVTGDVDGTLAIVSVGYSSAVSYGFPGGAGIDVISEPPPPPAG